MPCQFSCVCVCFGGGGGGGGGAATSAAFSGPTEGGCLAEWEHPAGGTSDKLGYAMQHHIVLLQAVQERASLRYRLTWAMVLCSEQVAAIVRYFIEGIFSRCNT